MEICILNLILRYYDYVAEGNEMQYLKEQNSINVRISLFF